MSNIQADTNVISVNDASGFPQQGTVLIGAEQIAYSGKLGNTLTGVQRGVNGTVATAHPSGSIVSFLSASVPTPAPPTLTPRPRGQVFVNTAEGAGCTLRRDAADDSVTLLLLGGLVGIVLRRWRASHDAR